MRRFLRNNGLTLAFAGLFLATLFVMSVVGQRDYNDRQADHGEPSVGYGTYLKTGDFVEGVFENWESEFLQMATYVLFTAFLFQKGSPESKPLDEQTAQDVAPERQRYADRPWAVRRGGPWLRLYMNSLAIALVGLFVLSLVLHAVGGTWAHNADQLAHGGQPIGIMQFVTTAEFWFQSMQNWQSEFLAVAALAFLSIFLRQQGSPESKPVAAPHSKTGP
jgi:Domain of unknown function (DUF6766)